MAHQTALDLSPDTDAPVADPLSRAQIAPALLNWYDHHARVLPWRVAPAARLSGVRPDPYRVWLSEIMLQQTTVATVAPRFNEFLARWPTVAHMARAPREDILAAWAGLGYYARARNLHACAEQVVDTFDGRFPDTEEKLLTLPGVGAYTAAAIAAIAFDERAIVLDGNIERVTARLFAHDAPLPGAKPALRQLTQSYWPHARHGCFAQALMDLGASVCRPKTPLCSQCPVRGACAAWAAGNAADYPKKQPKKPKPVRHGFVVVISGTHGRIAVETRPERGLLGGMLGLPGSDWSTQQENIITQSDTLQAEQAPLSGPIAQAGKRAQNRLAKGQTVGRVRHTFTHFHLELTVQVVDWGKSALPAGLQWADPGAKGLPTVMKKAVDLYLAQSRL
ncbi:MAG: A/G-specific adenine glycosylase [Pseudomonadota bacterium]